jgi:hypothetical protein
MEWTMQRKISKNLRNHSIKSLIFRAASAFKGVTTYEIDRKILCL